MIEVEIRAKLDSLDETREALGEIGAKFYLSEKLTDIVFGRPQDLDENNMLLEGAFSARVRQNNNKTLVELKEICRNGIGLEFSSPVNSIEDGERFLKRLDFEKAFAVTKTREQWTFGIFEICLDQVEKLGNFIEIEAIAKDGKDTEKIIEECRKLLVEIAPRAILTNQKYGDLMQELINKEKNDR